MIGRSNAPSGFRQPELALFPSQDEAEILDLFAGPGGWDMGARILGLQERIHGYDTDRDACATATAAGFSRTMGDVAALDPSDFPNVTGLIMSPPCPTFSAAGRRSGIADYQDLLDAITHAGSSERELANDERVPGCGCTWSEILKDLANVTDDRSRLVAQVIRFALHLPKLQWLVCEQVPSLEYMWEDVAAELFAAGWETANVLKLDAADYGAASHRRRVFLYAHRTRPSNVAYQPSRSIPKTTMANALEWPPGERINTRGTRRTSGGNEFSADTAAWCLTEKARSWYRISDGERLSEAKAGLLVGFPSDYPWRGSRTKRFLQAADAVSPIMAATILGTVLAIPWDDRIREYLMQIYGHEPADESPSRRQPTLRERRDELAPTSGLEPGCQAYVRGPTSPWLPGPESPGVKLA